MRLTEKQKQSIINDHLRSIHEIADFYGVHWKVIYNIKKAFQEELGC